MSFNSNTIMSNAVLNMLPTWLTKMTTAVVKDVTILRKSLDDSCIWHFMRCVENLKIRKWTIHILKGKRLIPDIHYIMAEETVLSAGVTEGEDNFPRGLTLDAR